MEINPDSISSGYQEKFDRLTSILKGYGRVALAFSGGVDSAFLLAAGAAAAPEAILAVTLVSRFFTAKEKALAGALAKKAGVEHQFLKVDVLADPQVVKNDKHRCYYCKAYGFSLIKAAAAARGMTTLVHGINLDDLGDYRPGIAAAKELGFKAPLVDAGFTKQEIRECSRQLGLPTWDLPSQSCLATRIPVGDPITEEALEKIEQAEDLLHKLGFAQVRVRYHGSLARIETPADDIARLAKPDIRCQVTVGLKQLGFTFISLDLDGYATGKMNTP